MSERREAASSSGVGPPSSERGPSGPAPKEPRAGVVTDVSGPRPTPVGDDAVFWEGVRDGRLLLQRCDACNTPRHPPRPICARCGSTASSWAGSAGTGEVWSFTIIHGPTLPEYAERTPYGAVVVRLDDGVFLVTILVDCPPDELAVGMAVEFAPTLIDDELSLPTFRRRG